MSKILLDKYYTPIDISIKCIGKTLEICKDITEIIEPSAGDGSFSLNIPNCIAYDIEPEHESIIKQDFLKLDIEYKKGRLFIGNPPFGNKNLLVRKFYTKCVELGDFISFILPITQLENTQSLYKFNLLYSEDLGILKFSDREVHCCLNIYGRNEDGTLNSKENYKLKDIDVVEYKRPRKLILDKFDYSICSWGNIRGL
jgi:hypothetical protein